MSRVLSFQRVVAIATLMALAAPLSLFAETRSRKRTNLERLALDLERVFGRDGVSIETSTRPATSFEESIIAAMNRERVARGLKPLRSNNRLAVAASDRVDDMFAKRYFDHVSPDGIDPFTWATRRGYAYRAIGENLATGYRSAESIVNGWMKSPGHRQNILHSAFDEVGLGVAQGSPVRGYGGPLVVAMYASD